MEEKFNILKHGFYDHLFIVIYNGPPQTIYEDYKRYFINSEDGIIKAIEKCSEFLIDYITNPSENVMLAAVKRESYLFTHLKNPTKKVITYCIETGYLSIKNYLHLYSYDELKNLTSINPSILSSIPDHTEELSNIACEKNPLMIQYSNFQTLDKCKNAVKYFIENKLSHQGCFLSYIKYFDEEMVEIIIGNLQLTNYLKFIPKELLTNERKIKALKTNPLCLKYIEHCNQELSDIAFSLNINSFLYIPEEFQNEKMHKKIMDNERYDLVRYSKFLSQEDCNLIFEKDSIYISYIPTKFQTKSICLKLVQKDHNYLQKIPIIDSDILNAIFKSRKNIPRKDRFNFILQYNDDILEKILVARPYLLQIIPFEKQTDKLIKAILTRDGYAIQYVLDKKEEYVKIALENEPKAIKYINKK